MSAPWINAWSNTNSVGPAGQNWTKYSTTVDGNGNFVLQLVADNCSWIYLDGTLVGYQPWGSFYEMGGARYPVTLSGPALLEFIIFDGGGAAGGMYRLETTTEVFPDSDDDGLTDSQEVLYAPIPIIRIPMETASRTVKRLMPAQVRPTRTALRYRRMKMAMEL